MTPKRVSIAVSTVSGRGARTPLGEVIRPNLLLHLPLGFSSHLHTKPSVAASWAITQISSGMLAGYFRDRAAAEFFAERASQISPALADGTKLPPEDCRALGELRKACGGWAPSKVSGS